MKYIEKMHIEGLKKFERLDIAVNAAVFCPIVGGVACP